MDKLKKAAAGFVKVIKAIVNAVKFFSTQVGWVVGILLLLIFLLILISVLINTLGHAIAEFLGDDVGISSEADYDYMVSSIGSSGYDSFVSEKNFQEYMAYEYAVLMDVAEYLYEGQQEYINKIDKGTIDYRSNKDEGPRTMPYLKTQYTDYKNEMSDEIYKYALIKGQASYAVGPNPFTSYKEATKVNNNMNFGGGLNAKEEDDEGATQEDGTNLGGNKNVSMPLITYEYKLNAYQNDKGSLVPYINITRDDLTYHYYSTGEINNFKNGSEIEITDENVDEVNFLKINYALNDNNGALPKSTDYALSKIKPSGVDVGSINYADDEYWPVAESEFEKELYYNDTYSATTYKISLQTLIDRFLPKANLLTSWFTLKGTDFADVSDTGKQRPTGTEGYAGDAFGVGELMKDIKAIYNYYCWQGETIETESVQAVKYDEVNGSVVRNESGEAEKEWVSKNYASTNKNTFLSFGQVGLESNRYGKFKEYKPESELANGYSKNLNGMPMAEKWINGDEDKTIIPVINDLLSESAYILDSIDFEIRFEYDRIITTYSGDQAIYNGTGTEEEKLAQFTELLTTSEESGELANDIQYLSGDVTKDEDTGYLEVASATNAEPTSFSDYIYKNVILPAEKSTAEDSFVKSYEKTVSTVGESGYRGVQQNFLNYNYVYPTKTKEDSGKISAQLPPSFYDNSYEKEGKDFAIYNFGIKPDDDSGSSHIDRKGR